MHTMIYHITSPKFEKDTDMWNFWKLERHFQEYEIILIQPRIAYMRSKN